MSGLSDSELRDVMTSLLRGQAVPGEVWPNVDVAAFCDLAERQGGASLVAERLSEQGDAPAPIRAQLRDHALRQTAVDLGHEADLRRMLAGFDEAGVQAVLFKGTPLAYTVYPRPDLRPRVDTDVLIAQKDRERTHTALTGLGYRPEIPVGMDVVMHQRTYVRATPDRPGHVVDVHWRVANPEVFRDVLSFEEAWSEAVPVRALGPSARGLGAVHATLVASVHRVAHHRGYDRLIWLYDLSLLADQLEGDDWARLVALATDRQVAAICGVSLREARDRLGASAPAEVLDALSAGASAEEVSAAYLTERRHAQVVLDDLRVLPTWGQRWRLMYAHAFPSADYMREVYAPASGLPLPLLYLRRILEGSRRWLARP